MSLHLKASDDYWLKREKQIEYVLKFVKRHILGYNSGGNNDQDNEMLRQNSLIMCGDFNGGPEEKFYERVVTDSQLGKMLDSYTTTTTTRDDDQEGKSVKQPTLFVVRQAEQLERVTKTLDYIFYSSATLQLTENLELPPVDDPLLYEQGLPNLRHSSDHFSLVSSFRFK